ncbi:hypothetical protein XELAEV_18042250mg [Xenopus laevis]|uniref:Uncharacterized protein n=1 Tax=Xenopus laevis TaxID=8355 RepID=A0A974C3W6_XENLA|nr:hypothetical protein XELAEV_18042250mg [Xenopus laevis]
MRPCDHAIFSFACHLAVGSDLTLHCYIAWEHFLSQVLHACIALRLWLCGHCIRLALFPLTSFFGFQK